MDIIQKLQKIVNYHFSKTKAPKILEAGCGSFSYIDIPSDAFTVGIDISQRQLDRNPILDEKILGDIQYFKLNKETYDAIICWHVLEHLAKPKLAINNFFNAIKENGIIIISSPNPASLKGLVTKFTPLWFHVFFYRYFYGRSDAGKEDTPPFKTYMRFFISPRTLVKFAQKNGFNCCAAFTADALDDWVGEFIQSKNKLFIIILNFLRKFLKLISFNLISDSEYILVFIKSNGEKKFEE
jgi:SAM-dependent methyltransferase